MCGTAKSSSLNPQPPLPTHPLPHIYTIHPPYTHVYTHYHHHHKPQTPAHSASCHMCLCTPAVNEQVDRWKHHQYKLHVIFYDQDMTEGAHTHTHTYTHWYEMWPIKLFNYSLIIALCIVLYPDPCVPLRNVGACMCGGEQDSNLHMTWSTWHAVDWYHI